MSKGDKLRPVDRFKFDKNFDEIKWKSKDEKTGLVDEKGKSKD